MKVVRLISSWSGYAGILDAASPANVPGFLKDRLEAGKKSALAAGFELCYGLFHLNGDLMDRAKGGELLSWCLLSGGSYKVSVEEHMLLEEWEYPSGDGPDWRITLQPSRAHGGL